MVQMESLFFFLKSIFCFYFVKPVHIILGYVRWAEMHYLAHVTTGFGDILVSLSPLLLSQLSGLSRSPVGNSYRGNLFLPINLLATL